MEGHDCLPATWIVGNGWALDDKHEDKEANGWRGVSDEAWLDGNGRRRRRY